MKKIWGVLGLCLLFSTSTEAAEIMVAFTPSENCENQIVQLINSSQKSIDAAVYAINNSKIVAALKSAHDRRVNLRILTDKLQAAQKSSAVQELFQYGVNIKVNSRYKIEHNKFAVFDNRVLVTGSYNWTNAASRKNSENCLFIRQNKNVIKKYRQRFDELWQANAQNKSDNWLKAR